VYKRKGRRLPPRPGLHSRIVSAIRNLCLWSKPARSWSEMTRIRLIKHLIHPVAPQPPAQTTQNCPHPLVETHQFNVSGLIVLSLFLCFHQVLQLAFSNLTPLAISFLCLVMDLQEAQTSSSAQS
jgi:hypothetical protein